MYLTDHINDFRQGELLGLQMTTEATKRHALMQFSWLWPKR